MLLATTLRYLDMKTGGAWDLRYYAMRDYVLIAQKYGIGMCAIMAESELEQLCNVCDGFFLPGSSIDIDPSYYGRAPFDPPTVVDEYALDQRIIDSFVKRGKPIFGICGGLQGLNVYFGGTLRYIDDRQKHQNYDKNCHDIHIVPGSFVDDVFHGAQHEVNSYHGQCIDDLAPDLSAAATAEDGIIEAVESKKRHIFATQWHPERSFHEGSPLEQELFTNFLRCCEENR